jgi:DNA-binding response OmpR family regulator
MPKKILVVDDDDDVLRFFQSLLEDNGYLVCTARDGVEAMEKMRAERPDLVTLDIGLPRKSGVKVYREMREDDDLGRIPILIVSGIDAGFKTFISTRRQVPPPEGYLEKPVALADVVRELERILNGPFGLDEAAQRQLPWNVPGLVRALRS